MNRLKSIEFTLSVGELYGMQIISQLSVCSCFLNRWAESVQTDLASTRAECQSSILPELST